MLARGCDRWTVITGIHPRHEHDAPRIASTIACVLFRISHAGVRAKNAICQGSALPRALSG